jgi:tetratricopeptide (TPR) repeat protein
MNRAESRNSSRWFWVKLIGLVAAGCWIYAPVLHGGWLWDDTDEIVRNRVLRDPAGWWKIWVSSSDVDYFPLKTTLQWFLWQFGGARPALHHLANLALHILSGLLFWRLLDRLGARLAWWGGLLFVVHPLAVESVAWISELKNTLSLPFLLLAMLAYVEFDEKGSRHFYLISVAAFLLAMLAKSSVVMFPAVILLYGWYRRGTIGRRDFADSVPFFAISAALGLMTLWFQHHRAMGNWTLPLGGPASRIVSAGLALAFYLGKCVLPIGLLPIYPQWSLRPHSLLLLLPWPALAALIAWLWTKRSTWGAPALLGLGFFILNLLPVLGFVPMAYLHISWVADHFAYVSMLGVIGLGVVAAGRLASGLEPLSTAVRLISIGAAVLGVALLASESRAYAEWFRSDETLWTRALQRDPSVWMAHKNLGYDLSQEGRIQDAIDQYRQALLLKPDFPEARNNMGSLLAAQGQYAEAMAQFREALRVDPGYAKAHNNLGIALAHAGDVAGAVAEYSIVLRLQPDFAEARDNLGKALAELGQFPEAEAQFGEALRLDPDDAEAHNNLGNALAHSGQLPEAVAQFREALRLKPDLGMAHANLGTALFQQGWLADAREQFAAALRLIGDDAEVHNNFGVVLGRSGDFSGAKSQYSEAIRLKPGYADAHTNLANLLFRHGDARGAAVEYAAAALLQPANAAAHDRLGIAFATLGRLRDARDQFEEALRLEPDYAEARANLERVEREIGGR